MTTNIQLAASNALPPAPVEFNPESIPASLRAIPEWAPYEYAWSKRPGKTDKIPLNLGGQRASTTDNWHSFAAAAGALPALATPSRLVPGLGINVTKAPITGIDLDKCVGDDGIAPWAEELVLQANTYTELSPSGTGLRLFFHGRAGSDWTNHDQGIEVYAGGAARFVTVTGQHIEGTPAEVRQVDPGFFASIEGKYRRSKSSETEAASMPTLLSDDELPAIEDLQLAQPVRAFLETGEAAGDRSKALARAAVELYKTQQGEDRDAVVLSLLFGNEHAMQVALDHRRGDPDKALEYLWKHHCTPYRASTSTQGMFEAQQGAAKDEGLTDDNPLAGFKVTRAKDFGTRPQREWIVHRVIAEGGTFIPFGPTYQGKTIVVIGAACCIATGAPWHERETKQAAVLWIGAEDPVGVEEALRAACVERKLDRAALPVALFESDDTPGAESRSINLLDPRTRQAIVAAGRQLLKDTGLGHVVIVVDTLARASAGLDENVNKEMGILVSHLDSVKRAIGRATAIVIHHAGKDKSKGMRGASNLEQAADGFAYIDSGEVWIRKVKGAREPDRPLLFAIKGVVIGKDPKGAPIEAPVAVTAGGDELPANQRVLYQRLLETHLGREFKTADAVAVMPKAIAESTVKDALGALLRAGLIEKTKHGHYQLTPRTAEELFTKAA